MGSDREAVCAAFAQLKAARAEVAALRFDSLTPPELLGLLEELETDRRSAPTVEHQILQQLTSRVVAADLGAKTWSQVLRQRLRISSNEACGRLNDAADLGPRVTMTGEVLEPLLAHVAKRQAAGEINAEHIRVVRKFLRDLPAAVDYPTRHICEETLAEVAAGHTPDALRDAADRLAAHVNPDGTFSDIDRARRRYLRLGRQGPDGMSEVTGRLDPQGRATLEAVLAKLGAPGMCNPDDNSPCVDGQASQEQVASDRRTQGQRNHDALTAMGRALLASGQLGQHQGLPATIIVSTTLQELESGDGRAVTGGGSLLPMRDVIALASQAHHYLAVFDQHTREALYLGRAKRLASPGQRIVLYARDRGCTKPACTTPGYWCQVHHVEGWATGGPTDIDNLTLACGPDNRLVEQHRWTTRRRKDGRTEWIPPPHLDTGQARTNNYHHPERYLQPDDDDP